MIRQYKCTFNVPRMHKRKSRRIALVHAIRSELAVESYWSLHSVVVLRHWNCRLSGLGNIGSFQHCVQLRNSAWSSNCVHAAHTCCAVSLCIRSKCTTNDTTSATAKTTKYDGDRAAECLSVVEGSCLVYTYKIRSAVHFGESPCFVQKIGRRMRPCVLRCLVIVLRLNKIRTHYVHRRMLACREALRTAYSDEPLSRRLKAAFSSIVYSQTM